jgi:hypothetical protein
MFDFPSSPTLGQTYVSAGVTYVWNGYAWDNLSASAVATQDTPPPAPRLDGQLWWESDSGDLYIWYDDGNSQQWVQVNGGGAYALAHTDDVPPVAPVDGQLWWRSSNGHMYVYYDDGSSGQWVDTNVPVTPVQTAQTRNRAGNGAMQISQENGNTGAAASSGANYYPADQYLAAWGLATGTASAVRNAPATGDFSISLWTAVGANFTASSYASINHRIEGVNIADFLWGTASAKQAILRFTALHQGGGTFTVSIQNGAQDRAFLAAYTLTAGVWKDISIIVPGDVTGTWLKDSGVGINIQWQLGTGSNYTGVPGWQAGNKNNLPGSTNALATANQGLAITNVGLYLDPLATGIAPSFEYPNVSEELARCQRYWEPISFYWLGNVVATANYGGSFNYVQKRTTPTVAIVSSGNQGGGGCGARAVQAAGIYTTFIACAASSTVNGGGFSDNYTVNARM